MSTATQSDCTAALQHYIAAMQPLLQQMSALARNMDDLMKSSGDRLAGDMECGVQVMSDELAHHQAVACVDIATNHAEVERGSHRCRSAARLPAQHYPLQQAQPR